MNNDEFRNALADAEKRMANIKTPGESHAMWLYLNHIKMSWTKLNAEGLRDHDTLELFKLWTRLKMRNDTLKYTTTPA